jgi:AcrR family transcriptional regulator
MEIPRRDRLCDAAISLIARSGLRGLTHRAVDQTAGVPEGSTSYYFRTRLALLKAVTDRLLMVDLADAPTNTPTTVDLDTVAELAAQTIAHWVGAGRDRMLARYEISLESTRQPELRDAFVKAGRPVRALIVHALSELGAPDPQRQGRDFVACLDGLIYDQLAGAGGPRSKKEIKKTLREILTGYMRVR